MDSICSTCLGNIKCDAKLAVLEAATKAAQSAGDNQLDDLNDKDQSVRFILNGKRCGEHDLLVAWVAEGKDYYRKIKVVVMPQPG
jgi:hypothetical protein